MATCLMLPCNSKSLLSSCLLYLGFGIVGMYHTSICFYVPVGTAVGGCACAHLHMWGPEVDTRNCSIVLSPYPLSMIS